MTTDSPPYDIERVRAQFPSLDAGTAYFDSPGGTQTPASVGEAIRATLSRPLSNRGHVTGAERNASAIVASARAAMGDLLNVADDAVIFGRSATSLTFDLARTISRSWGPSDEVIVTRLDHNANVAPWLLAARTSGAMVRWVDFDPSSAELDTAAVEAQLSSSTRLVAITAASNVVGTQPDIPAIARAAHAVGALVFVDGVHYAAHAVVDVQALGADFFTCSPYKFLGPHLGVVAGRPEILEQLSPDKLLVSPDTIPERFELGTLPYELLSGCTAAVDFLAQIAPRGETRRKQLEASMSAIHRHESALRVALEEGLHAMPQLTIHSRAARRTPTLLVSLADGRARAIAEFLAAQDINAPAGHFYAVDASRRLGLGDDGGLRIGLAPYNHRGDVDRLLNAAADFLTAA